MRMTDAGDAAHAGGDGGVIAYQVPPRAASCFEIRVVTGKGRGVFTLVPLESGAIVDFLYISPVLLFDCQNYEEHGKHTVLDHYTYNWTNGSKVLALGLGSMFNHSRKPNLGFILDYPNMRIIYKALRDIEPNIELCISYGSRIWFDDMDDTKSGSSDSEGDDTFLGRIDDDVDI